MAVTEIFSWPGEKLTAKIFHNSLRHFFDENFWEVEGSPSRGTVPVNISETEQEFVLDVVAPGCKKEDFRIVLREIY